MTLPIMPNIAPEKNSILCFVPKPQQVKAREDVELKR